MIIEEKYQTNAKLGEITTIGRSTANRLYILGFHVLNYISLPASITISLFQNEELIDQCNVIAMNNINEIIGSWKIYPGSLYSYKFEIAGVSSGEVRLYYKFKTIESSKLFLS